MVYEVKALCYNSCIQSLKGDIDNDRKRRYTQPSALSPQPNHALYTIHIALLLYDPSGKYSQHAGIVMTSIFENTNSPVTVHILHDETLTDDNRQKLILTAERYNQTIDLIDVREYKKGFNQTAIDLAERRCTIGSLYRFFIPDILKDLDRILYFDCDIIVNLDVKEMWDIDINNYCLAAVHSKGYERPSEAVRDWLNGSRCKTFINAGVMYMNLNEIRKHGNLFDNAIAWIDRRVHLMEFSDQDVMNNLFYGSIKLIDAKYNNPNPKAKDNINDSIIHTPGHRKTWNVSGLPVQKLYWHYYIKSAWGEGKSPDEMIDVLFEAVPSTKKYIVPPLWKRIINMPFRITRRILNKIFDYDEYEQALKYIFIEISYRIKHMLH